MEGSVRVFGLSAGLFLTCVVPGVSVLWAETLICHCGCCWFPCETHSLLCLCFHGILPEDETCLQHQLHTWCHVTRLTFCKGTWINTFEGHPKYTVFINYTLKKSYNIPLVNQQTKYILEGNSIICTFINDEIYLVFAYMETTEWLKNV